MAAVTTVQYQQPATQVVYQQPPPPQATTVVLAQGPPQRRLAPAFHDKPVSCKCPNCQSEIVSQLTYEIGTYTVVLCLIIALLGLVFGCCIIPFFLTSCKDVAHHCPHCRSHLGTYRKM